MEIVRIHYALCPLIGAVKEAAPPLLPPSLPPGERVVLVTGVAGFVGSHVALELVRQWGAHVVGLDSFNHYYDVQLKKVGVYCWERGHCYRQECINMQNCKVGVV